MSLCYFRGLPSQRKTGGHLQCEQSFVVSLFLLWSNDIKNERDTKNQRTVSRSQEKEDSKPDRLQQTKQNWSLH